MARVNYNEEWWCGFCGNKFKHGEEQHDKRGRAICPKDGTILRFVPRNKTSHKQY